MFSGVVSPRQQSLVLFSYRFVTFASSFLQALNVDQLDSSSAVSDEPEALKLPGDNSYGRAPDTKDVANKFLCETQRVALSHVPSLKEPTTKPRFNMVDGVARRGA